MKILSKLVTAFLAVALLAGVVGVVGIIQILNMEKSIEVLSDESLKTLEMISEMETDFLTIMMAVRSMGSPAAADDEAFITLQLSQINENRGKYQKVIEQFENMHMVPEEKKLFGEFKASLVAAGAYNNSIIALVNEARKIPADTEEGKAERDRKYAQVHQLISGNERVAFDNLLASLYKLHEFSSHYYGQVVPQAAIASAWRGLYVVIGTSILAFFFAVALGIFFGSSISKSLRYTVRILGKIASGDVSEKMSVKTKDEFKELEKSINHVEDTVAALVADAGMLSRAAVEGKLATRADASKHQGDYKMIVEGVNDTLDAVIGPLSVAADYVDRISKGDIPEKISDTYNGDFNTIKNNLNICIDSIGALVSDSGKLVEAAVAGKLATRADASKHQGDYRKIVDGVNRTLDLVITPVNETIGILKKMAEGDLTTTMTGDYKGDFEVLKTAFNESLAALNEILGQVSIAVEQVNSGAEQVSQASQSLSQGATEQASSLEEITSSVTEIASQTKQNTENAIQVNGLSKSAKESAEHGNVQMKDLVTAMSDINKSAEEIRKIVKAIDDIAFQINLLALNANVEAARAGKYGKGFAVVAEEVRNLAVHSASSVKDTTRMVDEAIGNISRGNALVEVTAKQLAEIVGASSKVADLAEEVATASKEQSQGLEQVSGGLGQIDQVTQSNTASSEESASAAEELSAQAQQLRGMLQKFRISVKETKSSNEDILTILRNELARQGMGKTPVTAGAAAGGNGGSKKSGAMVRTLRPQDVISLEDGNFGKF